MQRKKGGLGKGLAALIPSTPASDVAVAEPPVVEAEATVSRETPAPEPQQDIVELEPVAAEEPSVSRETPEPDDGLVPVPGARFQLVPLESIEMNPKQPRQIFDEAGLEELKTSLTEVGLLQPIAVRKSATGDRYELIMGERRTRAARELGWDSIPAIVRETKDEELLRDALLENIHRVQLNPLEEGAAYQQLLDEFGVTQEELSRRIGRSRPQISNTIRLLSLPAPVQRRVASGVLSAGHARAILGLGNAERQDAMASRIVAEGLSVRTTEELVKLETSEPDPSGVSRETPLKRNGKLHAPGVAELADRLSDRFDTRVKVALGQKKGRIVIEFGSVADLERIAQTMGLESHRPESSA
jgi:ParB family chromosome partitioning protein